MSSLVLIFSSLLLNANPNKKVKDIFNVPSSISELPSDIALLDEVNKNWGPILEPNNYPSLYHLISRVFTDLSLAQERLTEGSATTVNYIHIVNSSDLNAFVWTDNQKGVRLFSNHLFLTTEMIRHMMKGVSPQEGLLNLAGVMAHELGHPMDKTSTYKSGDYSIENHYGSEASQAIEIRADIDGARILREASYAPESLYHSLLHLFSENNTQKSLVGSLSSSHPHKDFRLTSARLFLTLDRLEKGLLQENKKIQFSPKEMKEFESDLNKLISRLGRYPYKVPQSLAEILDRIKKVETNQTSSIDYKNLEFNRLVLSFDQILWKKEKENKPLSQEERLLFKEFIAEVFKIVSQGTFNNEDPVDLYKPDQIRGKINPTSGVSGLENSPSHFYFIERLQAYRLPEVTEVLKYQSELLNIKTRFQSPTLGHKLSQELYAAASVSDPSLFFKEFGLDLEEHLSRVWLKKNNQSDLEDGSYLEIFESLGIRFQTYMAQLGHSLRKGMQKAPFDWKMYSRAILKQWSPLPVLVQNTEKNINPLLTQYRQALIYFKSGRHPEMKSSIEAIQKIANDVWEARGFYGTTEILFQKNKIDWRFIFEVLNLQKEVALNQIEAEVQKYMRGQRTYTNSEIPPYKTLTLAAAGMSTGNLAPQGLESWLLWNTKNLKKLILDQPSAPDSSTASTLKMDSVSSPQKENSERLYDIYSIKEKRVFSLDYKKDLEKTVKNGFSTEANFLQSLALMHLNFFNGTPSYRIEIKEWDSTFFLTEQLNSLSQSTLSLEQKKNWFEAIFLKKITFKDAKEQKNWNDFIGQIHLRNGLNIEYMLKSPLNEKILEVYQTLFQTNSLGFFSKLKKFTYAQNIDEADYFQSLDISEKELQSDLKNKKIQQLSDLQEIVDLVVPKKLRKTIYENELQENEETERSAESLSLSEGVRLNSARIQRIKKTILKRSTELKLTQEQKERLFLNLTESGPTRDTDELFRTLVKIDEMSKVQQIKVLTYLEEGRFASDKLKLDLAHIYVGGRVNFLNKQIIERGGQVDRFTLDKLMKDLNRYAPNGSIAKDDFIESIAWSLRLKGSELNAFIDDQKSQNWRKANPMLIRVGSLLANQISNMKIEGRLKIIEYLLDPVNNETTLFNDIFEELKRITYNDLLSSLSKGTVLSEGDKSALKQKAERTAEVLKLKAEEAIRDSAPSERIPLYEVTLTSGTAAPIHLKDWPVNITRRYLNFEPHSTEEALFLTFLEVMPKHEHSVALAYMLSLANDKESGSIAQLFEVFGTVGIKFGQLISIWKIFGEEMAQETANLKSKAKSLTRSEIMNSAYERHHAVRSLVEEFEKILGSASVKTSTRVRLKDGSLAALSQQGEHVPEIISMNIQLGKQYLERLKEKSIIKNSKFMMNLVEALEEQLVSEIDMVKEAEKAKKFNELVKVLSSDLKSELKGWTLTAPQTINGTPLTSQMAFYELGKKMSFSELSSTLKLEIGPILAKVNLRMLFKYGWFDPDRHSGNFLVDPDNKTIYFLDPGQLENFDKSSNPFKYDPRLVIGKFIKSLVEFNAKDTIYYAKMMERPGVSTKVNEKELEKSINQLFDKMRNQANPDFKSLMSEVITEIGEADLKFDTRYIFGGLKGLIILYGESYVDEKQFENLLRSELKQLFISKLPLMVADYFKFSKNEKSSSATKALKCSHIFNQHL